MLGANQVGTPRLECRADRRYPFPYVMHLTPVREIDGPDNEVKTSIVIVGKHLSRHGMDFYHRDPLPYRRMVVSMEDSLGRWVRLLMDVSWCRFIRNGWYASGGRFLRVVDTPWDGADASQPCEADFTEAHAAFADTMNQRGAFCIPW
jgi:hypothetical protein